ncbi:hypothetical protein F511_42336 [Dorcoceras hygrometricum]|uniref:Uncharacterized protein n=1 Tax=Dorcoceras hygrometricum TaxID=472368 RepID=A0A2Z7BPS1_9LAMI|nr:hypothetical protein F511_42336 [Dorcoceras hygrometricum]
MVKRLATSPHDPLGITDSACKWSWLAYSTVLSTHISRSDQRPFGKSRVARDPIAMHTSWRSNSDIASVLDSIGYPRMRASGESSTTKHRLLHASGPHPIPPPNDPNEVSSRLSFFSRTLNTVHRDFHSPIAAVSRLRFGQGALSDSSFWADSWNFVGAMRDLS